MARGTIYNNGINTTSLFNDLVNHLIDEMNERLIKTFSSEADLAVRFALGIRMTIRRAYTEPNWGRFIYKFFLCPQLLMKLWADETSPLFDFSKGIETKRFSIFPAQLVTVKAMIAGSVLSAIFLVLEGDKTDSEIGSELAELILTLLGLSPDEVFYIANIVLPELADI